MAIVQNYLYIITPSFSQLVKSERVSTFVQRQRVLLLTAKWNIRVLVTGLKICAWVSMCVCVRVKALWMVPEVHSSNIAAAHSPLRTSVGGNQHWYASLDFNLIVENCLHAQNERGETENERDITIVSQTVRHSLLITVIQRGLKRASVPSSMLSYSLNNAAHTRSHLNPATISRLLQPAKKIPVSTVRANTLCPITGTWEHNPDVNFRLCLDEVRSYL